MAQSNKHISVTAAFLNAVILLGVGYTRGEVDIAHVIVDTCLTQKAGVSNEKKAGTCVLTPGAGLLLLTVAGAKKLGMPLNPPKL